jgi:hypothetical protein
VNYQVFFDCVKSNVVYFCYSSNFVGNDIIHQNKKEEEARMLAISNTVMVFHIQVLVLVVAAMQSKTPRSVSPAILQQFAKPVQLFFSFCLN